MEGLGFLRCQRDHAVSRNGDWVVCVFRVDSETGVGSYQQLELVARVLSRKYGISREGEMRWTLGVGVNREYITHTISLSQGSYI